MRGKCGACTPRGAPSALLLSPASSSSSAVSYWLMGGPPSASFAFHTGMPTLRHSRLPRPPPGPSPWSGSSCGEALLGAWLGSGLASTSRCCEGLAFTQGACDSFRWSVSPSISSCAAPPCKPRAQVNAAPIQYWHVGVADVRADTHTGQAAACAPFPSQLQPQHDSRQKEATLCVQCHHASGAGSGP